MISTTKPLRVLSRIRGRFLIRPGIPLHTHFALATFDSLFLKTRFCKVLLGAGYLSIVSQYPVPRYIGVVWQLAENSAYPTRFSGKARSLRYSTKGRDAPCWNLTYGEQHACFGVSLITTFQCGRVQRD